MKLSDIQEARYAGKDRPVYYFEYYPHYHGTLIRKFETSLNTIGDIYLKYQREGGDAVMDDVSEIGDAYAFWDAFGQWPIVRKQLETKGHWADGWEEGSQGLSIKSMRDAREAVKVYEMNLEGQDWGTEDDKAWAHY